MPLLEIISKDEFEAALEAFTRHHSLDQLDSACESLEELRQLEHLLIRVIRGAMSHEPCDNFVLPFFPTEIQAELKRRLVFIGSMKQEVREKFAQRLYEMVEDDVAQFAWRKT